MNKDKQIIEAVPNFSEGRRTDVVDAIVDAIQVPGVLVLNRTSDWDHHRSVVTLAGEPSVVLDGLFQAIKVAAQRIDLFQHRGVHPRLGATDVVPLVPIQNVTLDECVALANQLGERIGQELELPVYLYEAAARQPNRKNLADIRRGEFEQLVDTITRIERLPDYGPQRIGPAGAVVVGARPFLIAYNVYLQTDDVHIAKKISHTIRESNGGLPAVKALGLLVGGQAQVSMNLVDFTQTPLHRVIDEIRALATEHGTEIDRSELIGLMPHQAILDTAAHYLHLPTLSSSQIVESVIDASMRT
ncbi:glutamate formimidoyltransferase [Chloroflexi bacterium TSY]|nr:glutamate formimidoyltransferase [Chloroflexi bacterium TSY]